ncbi:TRAP transporter large permease subunit [Vibrio astriarenae]|uniref:TRAP transporter large permease protein n=1 Tax=Vibrio astriarenae TaxID=1481923 RepID=A0A7Z2YDN7_9VIBR|nr:TRAP transporter large permease [Vibrio astriarenae]QIA63526.1 TRAP transporter large permease subunit [Vibrio astriarenae]
MDLSTGSQMIILFFALIIIGVPVAFCLALSSLYAMWQMEFGLDMVADLVIASGSKYTLLAIPFFILAGNIMGISGIAERMITFFRVLVEKLPGNMGLVGTVVCLFWGSVSGSGPASVAAIGPLIIKGMVEEGYSKPFAAGLVSTGAALSLIIPPSIGLVIYGVIAETSISDLFLATIVPGLMLGSLMILILPFSRFYSAEHDDGESISLQAQDKQQPYFSRLCHSFAHAFWGLFTPVLILGGIYGGIFTPTEAAIVASVYAIAVGSLIYRTINLTQLYTAFAHSACSSAVVMIVVAFAGLFGWVIEIDGLVVEYSEILITISEHPQIILFVILAILLVAGMFMDAITIMYITLPIFLPVVRELNIDLTWFGVLLMTALSIGLITPPVGINLFVAANITRCSLGSIAKGVMPFLLIAIFGLCLLVWFPQISLFLL